MSEDSALDSCCVCGGTNCESEREREKERERPKAT
jgi:hypothetical protein